jgi:hypothetical protein
MIHTHFDISIRVFCVDFTRVSLVLFTRYLLSRALLRSFLVLMLKLRTGLMHKHRHLLETARALMIASSIPPHFWVEAVSIATYLINIQPSSPF